MLYAEFHGPFWGHQEDKYAEKNAKHRGLRERICSSAYCRKQTLDKKRFKEEEFILTDSLRGSTNTGRPDGRSAGSAGHTTSKAKKRNRKCPASCLPWIKS